MSKRKKYPKHESEVIQLTPKYAKELLDLAGTVRQRPIKPHRIEEISEAMKRGLWDWTGESIILDWDGIVRNGVHRLMCIVETGVTIETTISVGVNPEVFKIIDGHSKRSLRDALGIAGENYTSVLSAALIIYDGYLHHRFLDGRRNGFQRQDAFKLLGKHPKLRKYAADSVCCFDKKKILPSSMVTAFHYIFATDGDKQKADDFFNRLATGENLSQNHPILCLRETLRDKNGELRKRGKMALLIKAWNVYLDGEKINNLSWRDQKTPKEPFPKIEGLQKK